MLRNQFNKLTALLLVVVMTLAFIPSALAAQADDPSPATNLTVEPGDPGTVTDQYINESDGREIAPAQTVKSSELKNPQAINGYVYSTYSEVTEHVYAKEDLTYILGYPDKTVRGERFLSRAEAAVIFFRLYDGFYPPVHRQMTSTTFSDIPQDAWYYSELELCYNAGIIDGYADGTFRPNEPITRAEFAILAARFAELPNSNKQMFTDVTRDHWAYLLINAAAEAGWIQGYGDGTYRPETTISRSEAVTLINRMRNRSVTVEKLKELGVANPYTDLVETYWAFSDLMEATVKHAATEWHELTYNGGNLNIIIEKYVDDEGNEIAEQIVSQGRINYAPRLFDRHYFLGYITTITYIYSDGAPHMTATKSADRAAAKVGETLTYTITATNDGTATANLENVIMTDAIPKYINFTHGSVQVDGVTTPYSYDNAAKVLSVALGDIAPGQIKTVTFTAVINSTAYGKTITNTAILSADNDDDQTASDDGVTVEDGAARMSATKTVDKSTAKVGDSLTYTVTVSNAETATVDLKNVIMRDVIPTYLTFSYGSVQVDSVSAQYAYDSTSGLLSVGLGDIAPGHTKTITFAAVINASAYNQRFYNVAALSADNDDDKTAKDGGVTVDDGIAKMSATKSVDKATAKVGDSLTYTITATNAAASSVNLRDVVMSDAVPGYLTFTPGSVQVDGYSARYSYDNESKLLSVELGDVAPGQTKTITLSAMINSTAYGKGFNNVAVLSADNDGDKAAEDDGVTVADGTAEGSAGAKTVSSPTAKVGDTLTYSITLRNASTATAAWKNVRVSDVIPEYLDFVSGSVEEDGRASVNASYNAGAKTLTLFADSIDPGETKTFTFKVTVQDGAQGRYIVNTAVVSSESREDIQLPDTGVAIDAGNTIPYISKTASVTEARAGDIFSYNITVKNGADATAAWKNVVLSDVFPAGVKLVAGSVTLNGSTVSYGIAGQAIEVTVGDLKPGADAVVSFDVRVLDDAVGTTIYNVAVAKGDNGEKTATDNGVTVPDPENETPVGGTDPKNTVTGSKNVDKTIVNTGEQVTYTITAVNNTTELWTGVQVYDVLDTSVLTFIDDSVYINGMRYLSGSGKWTFTDRQLVVNLGDIAAGQSVKCTFSVQFKNDAANTAYTNHATIISTSHDSVYVKAPEVTILHDGGGGSIFTDIHYKLFAGFGFGDGTPRYEWRPTNDMQLSHMCIVGYRLMTDFYRSSLGNGTFTVPDDVTDREAQYFISQGVITADEYSSGTATQSQIYRILNFAIGANLHSTSGAAMSRASVATLVCDLTGRDKNPNTNGLHVAYFSDKGLYTNLIDEVSNSHDYTMDSRGNETWLSILKD